MVAQWEYSSAVESQVTSTNLQNRVHTYTFDELPLQRGGRLGPITLAYETWGTLNVQGTNAILITHSLTGSSHAYDPEYPDDPKAGWWNLLIGPGRVFDTSRYFVICSNILGGCYGSTGPSSIDPHTGRPYGMRFPIITISDMVHAQRNLIAHLGVRELAMVAGWSIGGQQALEWAMSYPNLVRKVIVVAAGAAKGPQAVAFSEVQRQAIMADPLWLCGDYAIGQGPATGLAIARMMATITYQSEEAMEMRFARKGVQRDNCPSPTCSPDLGRRFDVENYLYHQGAQLAGRFDANSYLYISRAADLYDVSEGYPSLDVALQRLRSKALFVGIRSDMLVPAAHVRWLADKVRSTGGNVTYVELDSLYGHDACLKEWDQMAEALRQI